MDHMIEVLKKAENGLYTVAFKPVFCYSIVTVFA